MFRDISTLRKEIGLCIQFIHLNPSYAAISSSVCLRKFLSYFLVSLLSQLQSGDEVLLGMKVNGNVREGLDSHEVLDKL